MASRDSFSIDPKVTPSRRSSLICSTWDKLCGVLARHRATPPAADALHMGRQLKALETGDEGTWQKLFSCGPRCARGQQAAAGP